MKKYILTLTAALSMSLGVNAQYTMKVTKTDGTTIEIAANDVKEVTFTTVEAGNTYNGWTEAGSAYFNGMANNGDKAEFTKGDGDTYNLVLTSQTWGVAKINGISYNENGDVVTLKETDGTITMAGHGGSKDYDCVLKSGQFDSKSCLLEILAPAVMGGTTMKFQTGIAPAEKVIAKQYGGWSNANAAYFQNMATDKDTVTITVNDDATLKVIYKSETWGEGTFENVKVTTGTDEYTLSETNGKVLMPGMGGGEPKEYEAVLKSGTIMADGKTYTLEISIPAVMGGTTLTFQQGSAPQDDSAKARAMLREN